MLRTNRSRTPSLKVRKARTVMRFAVQTVVESLESRRLLSAYTLIDLGSPGSDSHAYGINNAGEVTGDAVNSGGATHGFLYDNGTVSDLGAFSGDHASRGNSLNDFGQIVGSSYASLDNPPPVHGFVYSGGSMQPLPAELDQPLDINSNGVIVGQGPYGGIYQPYVYDSTNGLRTLPLFAGFFGTAEGINDAGLITGGDSSDIGGYWTGYFYNLGTQTGGTIPTLGGGESFGAAVNQGGLIAGWSSTGSGQRHAILYDPSSQSETDLGDLGGGMAYSFSLNASGSVVGQSSISTGDNHAFAYLGGSMVDLNSLIPADSGWTLNVATGINDPGQIVGYGTINGETHAFLLTPTNSNLLSTTLSAGPDVTVMSPGNAQLTGTLSSGGVGIAGENVNFSIGSTVLGSATTDSNGLASLSVATSALSLGSYTVKLSFGGDSSYLSSSANLKLTVSGATTLTATNRIATYGLTSFPLSATLKAGGQGVAGQTVSFSIGGTVLGSAVTGSTGVANLTAHLATLDAGTYTVLANFAGSAAYLASSTSFTLTVNPVSLAISTDAIAKTYGQIGHPTGHITGSLRNGDTVTVTFSSLGDAPTVDVTSPGMSYLIVATLSGEKAIDYRPAVSGGKLTIIPAPLTVTANDNSKIFGQAATEIGTVSGIQNDDDISASFFSAGDDPSAPVGTYAISAALSGDKLFDYSFGDLSNVGTLTVLSANTAPVIDELSISPASPATNDLLTANVTSHDAEGDSVNYSYRWMKDGSPIAGATGATLDLSVAGNGDKGDGISVEVTPNDGNIDGNAATSAAVVVTNTAPVIDSVVINQSNPKSNDSLSATVVSHDDDGDSVNYGYQWYRNGAIIAGQTGSTLDLSIAGNGDHDDQITVQVTPNDGTDNGSPAASGAVTVLDTAPVANDDSVTTGEDTAVNGNVLGNDTDTDGDTLNATLNAGPAHGTLVLNADGSFTYTPNANFNGADTFTYHAGDGEFDSNIATVNLTINPVEDPPTVSADNSSVVVNEGDTATNTGSFDDVDLTDSVTITASEGAITQSGTDSGTWSWSKATSDDEASHVVTITAHDGHGGIVSTTFTLQVNNVAPTATDNTYTVQQGNSRSGNVITDDTGAGSDSDPAGANDPLTVSAVNGSSARVGVATATGHGSVIVDADGSFTYTPASTYSGADSFTYTISDGDGGFSSASVTFTIAPPQSRGGGATVTTITDTCMGGTALLINGTSGDDVIQIAPGDTAGTLSVTINGETTTETQPSGRIIVFGNDGNDQVILAAAVTNEAWLYGDNGNDQLNLGNGGGIAFGGSGNDTLLGANGRDALVGGTGADRLVGNPGEDILIAGYTDYDNRLATSVNHDDAWCHIYEEWNRTDIDYATRISQEEQGTGTNTAAYRLNANDSSGANTVHDDTSQDVLDIDTLTGSAGEDWFLANLGGGGSVDKLTGVTGGEVTSDI